MDNCKYVASLGVGQQVQDRCLAAMEKYGDNHWWEPDVDPRKFAYYQINEPLLLGDMRHLKESLDLLLGRPVFTHEMATDKFRQEVYRAWTYQVGVTSDLERAERVQEPIESLEKWAKANGKQFVTINLPKGA